MTPIQVIRATKACLQRTPITGAEAELMTVCKQWISKMEVQVEGNPESVKSDQVEPTSGK